LGRPRKNATKEVVQQENQELSKKEVYDVMEYARALASSFYPGIITPDLISARMKEASFTPLIATETSLSKALADPKNNEETLRSFVEYYEIASAPIRRIISYLSSLPDFSLQYTVSSTEQNDYKSNDFKSDQNVFFDYLDHFDYEYHFRNVLKQVLRNEIYACVVREDGQKIVLQEIPLQYVKITGKWEYGFLIDMNFYYFIQPGVSIEGWPDWFKMKYNELFGGEKGLQKYDPMLPPELRGSSEYIYWVSLPPQYGWCFKFDPSLTVAVPHLASILPEFIDQGIMRSLQKDINIQKATKIMAGSIPLLKDQGSKVANALALDPKTTGQFLALVKNALSSAIKVAAAPLENMSAISFDGDSAAYDEYLRTAVSSTGYNSALFYTSKLKANAFESQLSFESDVLAITQSMYPQFAGFISYWANKRLKKYRYNIFFEGNAYYLSRQQRFDKAMQLAQMGAFLPQKIASALGMRPHDLIRMLEENKANGYTDLLTPVLSAFQQGNNGGAPKKSDSEISDSGAETRETGANAGRGGKE
jgi:hypothetical protein